MTKDLLALDFVMQSMNGISSELLTLWFEIKGLFFGKLSQNGYFFRKTWESECPWITSRYQNESSWCLGESRIAMDDCIPVCVRIRDISVLNQSLLKIIDLRVRGSTDNGLVENRLYLLYVL